MTKIYPGDRPHPGAVPQQTPGVSCMRMASATASGVRPSVSTAWGAWANSVAISIEDDNDSLKSLLGNNYADNIAGGTRLQYVYPIDGAGYEALARAS